MTPQQLSDTFGTLADDTATPLLWSEALRMTYAADGELEAARRARLILDTSTAAICEITVGAVAEVDLASYTPIDVDPRVLFVRRVKLDSQDSPLQKVSVAELDLNCPGWEVEIGTPRAWIPVGDHQIRPYPLPDTADVMRLHVIRVPLEPITLYDAGTPLAISSIEDNDVVISVVLAAPDYTLATGDVITVSGATQYQNNGDHTITVLSPTAVTWPSTHEFLDPESVGATYSHVTQAVSPEIPAMYHMGIVKWMLHRAYMHRERQDMYRPEESARYLAEFEEEFGKKSTAVDETWINRKHGYDEFEGLY